MVTRATSLESSMCLFVWKVSDLGVAKEEAITGATSVVGTSGFRASELASSAAIYRTYKIIDFRKKSTKYT